MSRITVSFIDRYYVEERDIFIVQPLLYRLKLWDRDMSSSGSSSPPSKGPPNDSNSDSSHRDHHHRGITISRRLEIVILLSLLFGLTILAARPFGFRNFLSSMEHGGLYPMIVVFGIIAVILVLMQRLGIIFVDSSSEDDDGGYMQR